MGTVTHGHCRARNIDQFPNWWSGARCLGGGLAFALYKNRGSRSNNQRWFSIPPQEPGVEIRKPPIHVSHNQNILALRLIPRPRQGFVKKAAAPNSLLWLTVAWIGGLDGVVSQLPLYKNQGFKSTNHKSKGETNMMSTQQITDLQFTQYIDAKEIIEANSMARLCTCKM